MATIMPKGEKLRQAVKWISDCCKEDEDALKGFLIRIKSRNKEFAHLVSPRTCTYKEARDRLLNDETALIESYIGKKDSFIFVATKKDLYMEQLKQPSLLRNMVRKYLYFLTLENDEEFKGLNGGKRLCTMLLKPFQELQEQYL